MGNFYNGVYYGDCLDSGFCYLSGGKYVLIQFRVTEGKGAGKGKGFCLKSKVKGLKSKDKSQKTKV